MLHHPHVTLTLGFKTICSHWLSPPFFPQNTSRPHLWFSPCDPVKYRLSSYRKIRKSLKCNTLSENPPCTMIDSNKTENKTNVRRGQTVICSIHSSAETENSCKVWWTSLKYPAHSIAKRRTIWSWRHVWMIWASIWVAARWKIYVPYLKTHKTSKITSKVPVLNLHTLFFFPFTNQLCIFAFCETLIK